jgi:uncharacterized protein (TIGR03437 family)
MKRIIFPGLHLILLFSIASELGAQALRKKPYVVLGVTRRLEVSPDDNPQTAIDTANPNLVEQKDLYFPSAAAVDTSVSPPILYVADTGNHRVLGWKNASSFSNGAPADLVIGQKDFFTAVPQGPGRGLSTGFNFPSGLVVDRNGNLYVADYGNNRVLRFPKPFQQQDDLVFPDFVIGQTSFTNAGANSGGISERTLALSVQGTVLPVGLVFDASGNLFVTDVGNNRVLRYAAGDLTAGNNAPRSNFVLGQINFTSTQPPSERINKEKLIRPTGVAIDSAGRIYVTDAGARVLQFPANVTQANGAPASRVVGITPRPQTGQQPLPLPNEYSIGSAQGAPAEGIALVDDRLVVVDTAMNRLLMFDPPDQWPEETTNSPSPPAKVVFGQPDFRTGPSPATIVSPSASNMSSPSSARLVNSELYVADSGNHRMMVLRVQTGTFLPANRVLGQAGLDLGAPNSPDGREFNQPNGMAVDSSVTPPRLYVADTSNHRILGYKSLLAARTGAKADIVVGQVDFQRNLINSPTNDPEKPNQTGLYLPTAVSVDSAGNLYVADAGNGRVLRFPKPFEQTTTPTADLVIGQASFTTKVIDATSRTMRQPYGLALTREAFDAAGSAGGLLVSDSQHHRVLYFPKPFSNGMSATNVIGQQDFFGSGASGPATNRFNSPRHIAVDPEDRLYVVDNGNNRVSIFDRVTQLPRFASALQILAVGSGVSGIGISRRTGVTWVTESAGTRALRFPRFEDLARTNFGADSFVGAPGPTGAALDPFDNLVLSDSAHRVSYFVPSLSILNGANFAGGSLAPGIISSIFPFNTGNCGPVACPVVNFGTETKSFNDVTPPTPLPRSLASVEVLVEDVPVPLFFVSPGQINFTLPNGAAVSGTTLVCARNPATGQIFGFMDLGLKPTSPGLFTVGPSGSGAVAALNQDNSVHTPTNPIAPTEVLQLFGTGAGKVPGAPPEGTLTPSEIIPTPSLPRVSIGGRFVPDDHVLFSGMAPGLLAGVWQVNVRIPQDAPLGSSIQIIVYLNDVSSQDPTNPTRIRSSIAIRPR